jgi:8-oxo-dGTP pyrophosphatase MutT (NUDIX family)
MLSDYSYGVIPVVMKHHQPQVLLILHQKGHWAFPKGHAKPGETHLATARRELLEETGLSEVEIQIKPTFNEHYIYTDPQQGVIDKTVTFFLGVVKNDQVKILPAEVADYGWFNLDQAKERMTFDQGKQIIEQLVTYFNHQ